MTPSEIPFVLGDGYFERISHMTNLASYFLAAHYWDYGDGNRHG
jgi:hypothetical protein